MNYKQLYEKLLQKRSQLKIMFVENGRTPVICSDQALYELAVAAPRTKEDMANVNGLGEGFVQKYGDYFMEVLDEYHKQKVAVVPMTEKTRNTLKNLETRLVNISRKNNLLYMGKLGRFEIDMFTDSYSYNKKVLELLMGKTKQIVLSEMSLDEDWEHGEEKRFKKALNLVREVAKEERETGQYDLYIGYPFVEGKTFGEDFCVRAPLVLFPIAYEKKTDKITIKLDTEKDVLYNNNLVLMQNKFVGKNEDLPNNVIEEINEADFFKNISEFYNNNGIAIQQQVQDFIRFKDISANDFPKYKSGEYHLVNNAVIGKFSLYSNALQRDFKKLIDKTEINCLLDELLQGIEEQNFEQPQQQTQQAKFCERNISYINDLNASQEQAIFKMNTEDKLVIQGPPGTGKSQTITSLIADSVNKGKNVFMVSQKKAALDVIYSRLGNLSDYAIIVNDVKDKQSFYRQLEKLFASDRDCNFNIKDFNEISDDIDKTVEKFDVIYDKMFVQKNQGVEIYKLYNLDGENYFLKNSDQKLKYYNLICFSILSDDYYATKTCHDKFLNSDFLASVISYCDVLKKYSWLEKIKQDIKPIDRQKMVQECKQFAQKQTEFLKLGFINKLFAKDKPKKQLKNIFENYFADKKCYSNMLKNPQTLADGIEYFEKYLNCKKDYLLLDNADKKYLETIIKIRDGLGEDVNDINTRILDFVAINIIDNFENENQDVLSTVDNHQNVLKQISLLMENKKDQSKKRFKQILVETFRNDITFSKRYQEICRLIQSKRKQSISKFLTKFGFELFRGIKVWLMTPETVSEILPLYEGLFDILIFDEASQIYIEKGLPAIARASKVVVAGDHKQLRPSSLGFGRVELDEEQVEEQQENNAALEEESLLDLARFKYPSVLLNYHYRAKFEELINFSNYAFYDGKLNVSPNIDNPEKPPIEVIKIDNGLWEKRANKNEAIKVVETIKEFFKTRKNNETLGVITFNTNQRDAILDELDKECLRDKAFSNQLAKESARQDNGEDIGFFVKNIENVQGDERDCIMFSTAYAKNAEGKVVRNFGWLNQQGGENRLNVAISRAKRKIYLITSIFPQELYVDDLKNDGPKIFRKYLDYCFAISSGDKQIAKQILTTFAQESGTNQEEVCFEQFANNVYETLKAEGVLVDKNVGNGKYKIDLAIKDKTTNKYILGIELDTSVYCQNETSRERDVFRRKYLESRGWKVYRLWSNLWWKDSFSEIQKILKLCK